MGDSGAGEVTHLLTAAREGDREAEERLLAMVHGELRLIAVSRLAGQPDGGTLGPTMLVNECWLRLSPKDLQFNDRRHFYRLVALAMRDLVVEHVRRRQARKRGGDLDRVPLDGLAITGRDGADDVLEMDERRRLDAAIAALEADHPEAHEVVLLRFYAAQPYRVIAELMGLPEIRVRRLWKLAQAHLQGFLGAAGSLEGMEED